MGEKVNTYRYLEQEHPKLRAALNDSLKTDLDKLNRSVLLDTEIDKIVEVATKDGEFIPDVFLQIAEIMDTEYRDLLPLLIKLDDAPASGLVPAEAKRIVDVLQAGHEQTKNNHPTLANSVDLLKMYAVLGILSVPTQMQDILEAMINQISTAPAAQKAAITTANKEILKGMVERGLLPAGMVKEAFSEINSSLPQTEVEQFTTSLETLQPQLKDQLRKLAKSARTRDEHRKFGPTGAIEVTPLNGRDVAGGVLGGYGALTALLNGLSALSKAINGKAGVGENLLNFLGALGVSGFGAGLALGQRGPGLDPLLDFLNPKERITRDKLRDLDQFTTHAIYAERELYTSQPFVDTLNKSLTDVKNRGGANHPKASNVKSLPELKFERYVLSNIPNSQPALKEHIEKGLREDREFMVEKLYMMAVAFDAHDLTTGQQVEHFYTI